MAPHRQKQGLLRLVPEGEACCIWMTAGLVDYKLCDLEFDCAACPFDREMRHGYPASEHVSPSTPLAPVPRNDTRLYHSGHLWVKAVDGCGVSRTSLVRVGLDPFLAKLIFCIKQNILPAVGTTLVHDRIAFWIVDECGTLPLVTPVSGEVHSLNTTVVNNPDVARYGDCETGWLVSIAMTDQQNVANLMDPTQAARYWKMQEARFENLARAHLEKGHRPPTLADGGAPIVSWRQRLRREAYYQVLLAILR